MTKFKLFASALLVAMSVSTFAAENLVCEGLVTRPSNNNCAYGGTFAWTAGNANTMQLFALEAGDLANYASLKFTPTNFVDFKGNATGNKVRILFIGKNAAGTADSTVTKSFATINGGEKTINIDFAQAFVNSVTEIAIGGSCDSASVMIDVNSVKLVKSDATESVCEGFVARKNNNNCSYDASRFSWSASTANTMQMFALEAGALSNYTKLVLNTANFKGNGATYAANTELYRVMFYANGTQVGNTKKFASAGTKELVLSDLFDEDQIASITEIVIGGVVAKGSLHIGETYLEVKASVPTSIDDVKAAKKAVKTIENDQVFIIRDGVRYNALGQVVK